MDLSLPPASKSAFRMSGDRFSTLLLHGFTSTPYEVRVLGDRLHAAGAYAHGPVLPGHGTNPRELDHIEERQWLEYAALQYSRMPQNKRFVVGASMGGLLALHVAARFPSVSGLILLAPALSYTGKGRFALEVSQRAAFLHGKEINKSEVGGDIASPLGRERNPAYRTLPFGGMAALHRLKEQTFEILKKVSCPILLFHGNNDNTIEPLASSIVAEQTNAAYVEHHRLPDSQHVLGIDDDCHEISERTLAFCERNL